MRNILIQYEWNNHKAINQKKLWELFKKEALIDKLKIYRNLLPQRRLLLRSACDKQKAEASVENLKKLIELSVYPISDFIETSDIKTYEEAYLTIGIILFEDSAVGYWDESSSNHSKEEESFRNTVAKARKLCNTMLMRNYGCIPHDEKDFLQKLSDFEYVPPTTFSEVLKWEKERWENMYTYLDVGKIRAKKIAMALGERIRTLVESDESGQDILKRGQWLKQISKEDEREAKYIFNIVKEYYAKIQEAEAQEEKEEEKEKAAEAEKYRKEQMELQGTKMFTIWGGALDRDIFKKE